MLTLIRRLITSFRQNPRIQAEIKDPGRVHVGGGMMRF